MITHASCFSFLGPPSQPLDLKQHPNHMNHTFLYYFLGCFVGTRVFETWVLHGFIVHISFGTTLNSSIWDLSPCIELKSQRLKMLINKIVCKTCQLMKLLAKSCQLPKKKCKKKALEYEVINREIEINSHYIWVNVCANRV